MLIFYSLILGKSAKYIKAYENQFYCQCLFIILGGSFAQLIPFGSTGGGMTEALHSPARKGFLALSWESLVDSAYCQLV